MVLDNKISNPTNVSPVNRIANFGSLSKFSGQPVEEAEEYSAVYNDGASFYYENLGPDHQFSKSGTYRAPNSRYINGSLIVGSTKSFAEAFSNLSANVVIEKNISHSSEVNTARSVVIGLYTSITNAVKFEPLDSRATLNITI